MRVHTPAGEARAAVPLKGKVTDETIVALLNAEKLPPTVEFNDKNSGKIFGSGARGRHLGWFMWHACRAGEAEALAAWRGALRRLHC